MFTTEGEPLPNATVAVLQPQCSGCAECDIIWQGQADDKGVVSFELDPLPPGEYSSRIFAAKADGYAPSFRNEQEVREEDETRFIIGLRPIVYRNTGTVLNDKGEPVTNAEIGFFAETVEPWWSMSLYCPEFWGAHTDAEGRFSYELPEKRPLSAHVFHPDFAGKSINLGRIADGKPRPAPVIVSMMAGRVLYGWVKSGSPVAPAANAVVRVKLQPNCKCSSRTFQTTADEEGYCAFMGLPLGPT
ncbi:MAG: carboxypeptidase-like regulatory domain-containing protein [Candidatus Hydrogenedentes bacterium]|nr:carboxypeptidase-like regulatory domain-containing protein [Candidatus Hydrogenedentota bacterium]